MPTYQYACTACGHQLEAVQSFADEPLTECPSCEGRLRKLFSSVGVVFKGSGFYRTDSRAGAAAKDGAGKDGAGKGNGANGAATKDSAAGSKDSGSASKDSAAGSKDSGSGSSPTKPAATAA